MIEIEKFSVFCSVCSRILGLLLLIPFLLFIINQADDPVFRVYAILTGVICAVLICAPCLHEPQWHKEKEYYQANRTFWCQNKEPKRPRETDPPKKETDPVKKRTTATCNDPILGCPCDFVSFLYTACTGPKEKQEAPAKTTTEVKTKKQNPMGPKPVASNWRF